MNIQKILLLPDNTKVEYTTDAGEFKISVDTSSSQPAPDLTRAIAALVHIYAERLLLEDRKTMLFVDGLETGDDADGEWFCIHGQYRANNISYKIVTAKMREMDVPSDDEFDIDEYIESKAADYPSLLTPQEYNAFVDVIAEGQAYISGKRLQQTLDFGESAT